MQMSTADLISLGLGAVSIILGIFSLFLGGIAIYQAFLYKKIQERQDKIQEIFLKEQRLNLTYACVRIHELHRQLMPNTKINLRKDRASIYATSEFNLIKTSVDLSEIKDLLLDVMRSYYCDSVVEKLEMMDIHEGDKVCEITLRCQNKIERLRNIIAVNEQLERYGLYLSLVID